VRLGGLGLGVKARRALDFSRCEVGRACYGVFPPICSACGGKSYRHFISRSPHWVDYCVGCGTGRTMPPARKNKHWQVHTEIYSADGFVDKYMVHYAPYLDHAFCRGLELIGRHGGGGKLLDVGCGFGYFLRMAEAAGYESEGIEITEALAIAGRERYGVRITAAAIETGGSGGEPYDVITVWDALEHFAEPSAILGRLFEMLSKQGLLLVRVPDFSFARRGLPAAFIDRYLQFVYPLDVPQHAWHFSQSGLEKMFAASGFECLERVDSQPDEYTPMDKQEWRDTIKEMGALGLSAETTVLFRKARVTPACAA
jgi:2-polyprenyl-3-methyl-5-hydroxy-6-metoxy-1,4-benzoquinol methylase